MKVEEAEVEEEEEQVVGLSIATGCVTPAQELRNIVSNASQQFKRNFDYCGTLSPVMSVGDTSRNTMATDAVTTNQLTQNSMIPKAMSSVREDVLSEDQEAVYQPPFSYHDLKSGSSLHDLRQVGEGGFGAHKKASIVLF